MEVLMSQTRKRISRALVGSLSVIIVVALIAYLSTHKSRAVETAKGATPTLSASAPEQIAADPKLKKDARELAPPATAPSTQPLKDAKVVETSNAPLIDGKARLDAGQLLEARKIVNAALVGGKLSAADADQAKAMIREINKTVVFSPRTFADDEFGGTYQVQPGENLMKIAKAHIVTPDLLCRLNGISDPRKLRAGQTLKVVTGPYNAVVTKHDFTLEIWQGDPYTTDALYVTTMRVGLGMDNSTPTGKWLVAPGNKLKNPTFHSSRGEGIIAADDPKNPLGEYWLGLQGMDGQALGKTSYGIHGTIEPDSIGKMASHGCIRMLNEDVALVFEMLIDGKSTVTIRD
jgi:lipoprotein-anchoring transpeptidase ErfK/SrfK